MTPEEWQRVKAITNGALALGEHERDAFVAAQCTDPALRHEVQSLLEATIEATDLFEQPALTTASALAMLEATGRPMESLVGRRIGPYQVIAELGHGGMGTAYLAERVDRTYRKRVAIKLIKRGMDTDAIVRRFLQERQILADLQHPNIGMLLDGGSTDDGRPYFVMEHVEGKPIDVFCRQKNLSIRERLVLFRGVCDAVHHAHEKRVIHRDLKPGNIVVTDAGVPKLLDFGIAKLLDPDDMLNTGEPTWLGRAMTVPYASPEQVKGGEITAASDVYSLGVLLYELLAGRLPFAFDGCTREEAERLVTEQMPPPPSVAAGADARLRNQLAGALDAIVLMALRKEPSRRYPTVRALSDDIGRYLEGQPVEARATTWRSRLLEGRSRRMLAAAAAVVIVLGAAIAGFVRYTAAEAEPITSVAILPFAMDADAPDQDHLSEGIAENIASRLSRLSGVRVVAGDSVKTLRGDDVDPGAIGRRLGVAAALTGRVVHRAGTLQIQVALVDARNGQPLWHRDYDYPANQMQTLQAGLAQQIASGLRLRLSPEEQLRVDRIETHHPEAYELYLKGRYFWNKRTTDDFERSIAFFKEAVGKEPGFALAYSGLADAYGLLTEYHGAPASETYPHALKAAQRALELDDTLAEAHASLAYVKHFYEWDWKGAEAEYKRALTLDPAYATAHQWHAELLSAMGRHDEALTAIRQARALDPLSLIINAVEAYILYMSRRYDEAIAQCRATIDLDPNFTEVYEYLKRSFDQKGQYKDAIEARQMRRKLLRLDTEPTEALRVASTTTSHAIYWQKRLEQELREGEREGLQSFEMAEITAQAGDRARALTWLEKGCAESDLMMVYLGVAPNLDPLRAEPRFQALLAKGCGV